MKKITTLLLLIAFNANAQLKLKDIERASGAGQIPYTIGSGVMTYSTPASIGLLPNTTSLTINGTTKTFTSTPTFTVGDLFSTSSYTNPSWLSSLAWSKITGTPTTISGYGITDPLIKGNLTANYFPYAVSSSSLANSPINYDGTLVSIVRNFYTESNSGLNTMTLNNLHFYTTTQDGLGKLTQLSMSSDVLGGGNILSYDNGSDYAQFSQTTGTNELYASIKNTFNAPANNFPLLTASKLLYLDGSNNAASVNLGSGLSLSGSTLSATGTSSTTTVTGGSNITVTGTIPNYTVGVSTAPTFTTTTLTSTTTLTGVINHSMSASAASSSTVNLAALTGNYAHVTGTVTITSFGTVQAGAERTLVFDGALTLTSNTVSLILPGNANIQTTANDIAVFRSEGSGNWRCVSYTKNDESFTYVSTTITGYSVAPTYTASYKMQTRNTYLFYMYTSVSLIGNATAFTVTTPFNWPASMPSTPIAVWGYNAGAIAAFALPTPGSNVLTITKSDGTAFTNGSTRGARFLINLISE